MNDTSKVWMPAGKLSEVERILLAVPTANKPDESLFLDLLASKLQGMVDADPEAARRALEMSQDQAPELWAIAEEASPAEWGQRLIHSEGLRRLTSHVDWSMPGNLRKLDDSLTFPEIAEMLA